MSIIAGIDVGLNGGIAFYSQGQLLSVYDMPTKDTPWEKGRMVDSHGLHRILSETRPDVLFVERVHAMPAQGVSSMFSFGMSFQAVLSVLDIMAINYHVIRPQEWQKHFGVSGKRKLGLSSAGVVQSIYPEAKIYGSRGGIKDGRCDAILIALYGGCKKTKPP